MLLKKGMNILMKRAGKRALSAILIAAAMILSGAAGSASTDSIDYNNRHPLHIESVYSPTHDPAKTFIYGPDKVLDANELTSWQYSQKRTNGNGYRTYVQLNLSGPETVEILRVKNGFWSVTDGADQYWRNNRVRNSMITFQYQGRDDFTDPVYHTFADVKQVAEIDLGHRQNVTAVRLQVENVYNGSKFDDTAITYMEIIGCGNGYNGYDSEFGGEGVYGPGIRNFAFTGEYGRLNQKLATRSGPGTKYTEPGAFPASTDISVYYQTNGNGVMWGLVEFENKGLWYRVYTGMKRIDDAYDVPRYEEVFRLRTMIGNTLPLYGPGKEYAKLKDEIPADAEVKVYFQQNGYAMVDYEGYKQVIRGWVPLSLLN